MPRPARGPLGPGRQLTAGGHVRLTAGPDRGQYEHRVVFRDALREWNMWGLSNIPQTVLGTITFKSGRKRKVTTGWHIHHMDFNKQHNCRYNLLALDEAIHNAMTSDGQVRNERGYFGSGWYGGWNPQSGGPGNGAVDEEVPF